MSCSKQSIVSSLVKQVEMRLGMMSTWLFLQLWYKIIFSSESVLSSFPSTKFSKFLVESENPNNNVALEVWGLMKTHSYKREMFSNIQWQTFKVELKASTEPEQVSKTLI